MEKVGFKCEEDIIKEFRKCVFSKYGTLYGTIQKELNEAVKLHVMRLENELAT